MSGGCREAEGLQPQPQPRASDGLCMLPGPICKCTVGTTTCQRKTEKQNISAISTNQDVTSPGIAASADGELASPEGRREEGTLPTSSHQLQPPHGEPGGSSGCEDTAQNSPGSAGDHNPPLFCPQCRDMGPPLVQDRPLCTTAPAPTLQSQSFSNKQSPAVRHPAQKQSSL